MNRIKSFDATGIAPNGILYSGDLNAIQDAAAAQTDLTQSVSVGSLAVGESGLQLLHYGSGEARVSGALRTDGIFRGLGGVYTGAFTTTQRGSIAAGSRPYGLMILNSTTNQLEWNSNTDAAPTWYSIASDGGGYVNVANGATFGGDTTLRRTASATLQLGTATQAGTLQIGSTAQPGLLTINGQTATGIRLQFFNGTDTQPTFAQLTNGTHNWGPGGASATDTSLARTGAGILTATNTLNAISGFQVNGTALAASHLSNGVTGSGAVVLANAPVFTGSPTAPSPVSTDNSTKLATTAWVIQQGYVTTTGVAVASVFGRTGAVTAQTGDYSAAQVTNAADKSSASAQIFVGNVGSGGAPTAVGGAAGSTLLNSGGVVLSRAANSVVVSATAPGDTVYAFTADNRGRMTWGTGAAATDTTMSRSAAGVLTVGNILNATNGFQVNGVALAASHLSNGVTGSGAVVLATNATINVTSIQKNGSELLPAGVVTQWVGATAPAGWLLCNGQAVSRTTYSALFAAIGTQYGAGDGSTTFNVPNIAGRVPVGYQVSGTFATLGAAGGEETHVLTTTEMPSHAHTGTTGTDSTDHHHNYNSPNNPVGVSVAAGSTGSVTTIQSFSTGAITSGVNTYHTHPFTTNATGGTAAHNNLQPYIVMNYIIKV